MRTYLFSTPNSCVSVNRFGSIILKKSDYEWFNKNFIVLTPNTLIQRRMLLDYICAETIKKSHTFSFSIPQDDDIWKCYSYINTKGYAECIWFKEQEKPEYTLVEVHEENTYFVWAVKDDEVTHLEYSVSVIDSLKGLTFSHTKTVLEGLAGDNYFNKLKQLFNKVIEVTGNLHNVTALMKEHQCKCYVYKTYNQQGRVFLCMN